MSERSEDRESECKRNLTFGGRWVGCDKQAKIAMSSAVNMDAILRMRWKVNEALKEYSWPVLFLDFEPSVRQRV